MFRRLHRWTSLPLILFLLIVLATGVMLQFEEIGKLSNDEQPASTNTGAPAIAALSDQAIQAQLAEALASSRDVAPDFEPHRIELDIAPGRQSTRLALQPRGGPFVLVDHERGTVTAEMAPELPMHVVLIRLHTGALLGAPGVWLMLAASLILLFLAVSGGWLYWQMWKNRANRGRKALFWK